MKRLQIDTRAESELRRLSGGNQQKVVIARWLASGFKTLAVLRSDARHRYRHQAADLRSCCANLPRRDAAVLLFTSELPEIPLVCDRVIVLFGGKRRRRDAGGTADEATLLRAAHGLVPRARLAIGMTATLREIRRSNLRWRAPDRGIGETDGASIARQPALVAMPALLAVILAATVAIHPDFGSFDAQSLAMARAAAWPSPPRRRRWSVISGGIDLSIGSMMAVANVLAAAHDGERDASTNRCCLPS